MDSKQEVKLGLGSYRELEVWKLGRNIVVECYAISALLPDTEKFGLVSQIRRASVSIPANIAEGSGRKSDPSLGAFLKNALGSVFELETLLILAVDLEFLRQVEIESIMAKLKSIGIKLQNLISSLKRDFVREDDAAYEFDEEIESLQIQ